jgi:simple sugar transport system permease protein
MSVRQDPASSPNEPPVFTALKRTLTSGSRGSGSSLVTAASSVGAVLLALTICGVLLQVTGKNPFSVYQKMLETGLKKDKLYEMLQRATPLMISAVAVAIGFKMNLFNIGVEGQYKVATLFAAVVGAAFTLPAVAMGSAAAWASIAALLKVKRGVNEVISTIMLNSIALAVLDFLFNEFFRDDSTSDLNVKTKPIPSSGWIPDIVDGRLSSFLLIGLLVVFLYWIVVFKSRFGFRLRASGANAVAARTSGISSTEMVVVAMLISGAVAGLIGMQSVLGDIHSYGQGIPDNLGFDGIAVALLGRNHPLGIIIAACLFGFLDATSGALQLQKVPSSVVDVIQGVIVLTVVIVNQVVTKRMNRRTAGKTADALQTAGAAA